MSAKETAVDRSPNRLRPDKHEALIAGGREVFARDGYVRASIDAIATAAGVSTRTLYKHFPDKRALFAAVITESARQVATAEVDLIERHLTPVTHPDDVERALHAFASEWLDDAGDWLAEIPHSRTHRALIAQVRAEAAHLGTEMIAEWWQAGPGRVRAELATLFTRWSKQGLLDIADAELAVVQFSRLVSAASGPPASPVTAADRAAWIAAGVRLFVRGYQP